MKVTKLGRSLIEEREIVVSLGVPLRAYRDSKGFWTIGYGHLLSLDKDTDFSGVTWTQANADEVFAQDLAKYEKSVDDAVKVKLQPHQNDALVSFVYNLGVTAFSKSTLIRCVLAGDKQGAAKEFDKWVHVKGMIVQGLVNRRAAEKALFLS